MSFELYPIFIKYNLSLKYLTDLALLIEENVSVCSFKSSISEPGKLASALSNISNTFNPVPIATLPIISETGGTP